MGKNYVVLCKLLLANYIKSKRIRNNDRLLRNIKSVPFSDLKGDLDDEHKEWVICMEEFSDQDKWVTCKYTLLFV